MFYAINKSSLKAEKLNTYKEKTNMLAEISGRLTKKLQYKKYIDENETDVYSYSIEIFLASLINLIIVLGIGAVAGHVLECIIFSAAFVPMRMMKGGLHASNHLLCAVILAVTETAMLAVIHFDFCLWFIPILALFTIINLFIKVQSGNDALSEVYKAKLIKRGRIYTIACSAIIVLTSIIWGFTSFQFSLLYGLATAGISALISKIQRLYL